MLAMGTYKAFPERFATIHPRYLTPSYALIAAGIGSALFYSILTFTSENVLTDTIYSLGIMICFYYGLTAFACIWYFRHELFVDAQSFVFKFLFPLLGGSDCSRSSWSRFATAPHRQRRKHRRRRPRPDPLPRTDRARRGVHADHARQAARVLPRRDPTQGHTGRRRRRAIASASTNGRPSAQCMCAAYSAAR
jgi:hypothetical protein